jgi:hypothetical protein
VHVHLITIADGRQPEAGEITVVEARRVGATANPIRKLQYVLPDMATGVFGYLQWVRLGKNNSITEHIG